MSVGRMSPTRVARCGLVALTAALGSASLAFAAKPVTGATYTGHWTGVSAETILFKVSSNGGRVVDLSVTTPIKCEGGCGGIGSPNGGSAAITRKGTFKVTLKIPAPGSTNKSEGTDTVTGTFHAHGTASGKITSHFNGGSGGATRNWTATA